MKLFSASVLKVALDTLNSTGDAIRARLRHKKVTRDSSSTRGPQRRRRRRYAAIIGAGAAFLLGPMLVFHITLYRQNLAVARESFPPGPSFETRDRLLVISPHCDDETLGAGGTIAAARRQGLAVRVAFLTNGDGSRSTQIEQDARTLRRNSFRQLAAMRQRETVAALQELGVAREDIIFLGYPDGGTQTMWQKNWTPDNRFRSTWTGADRSPYKNSMTPDAPYCGSQVLSDISKLIAEFRPTTVITTHPDDTHPDHWAAYAYTLGALETLRLQASAQGRAQRTRLLTFLVHHGVWPTPHGYHPDAKLTPPADLLQVGTHWMEISLDMEARLAKKAALERYVSQLAFTPHYLRGFLRRNELFGVVPLGSLRIEASEKSVAEMQKTSVLRDPVRDSFVHELWAAGDIQSISARPAIASGHASSSDEYSSTPSLVLRVHSLAGARLSRRLSYCLALHSITAQGNRAANIEVHGTGSKLRATFIPLGSARREGESIKPAKTYLLKASRDSNGLKVSIPFNLLAKPGQAMSVLISSSTHLGVARLDQTGTGAVRILPTTTAPVQEHGIVNLAKLPAHRLLSRNDMPHTVAR